MGGSSFRMSALLHHVRLTRAQNVKGHTDRVLAIFSAYPQRGPALLISRRSLQKPQSPISAAAGSKPKPRIWQRFALGPPFFAVRYNDGQGSLHEAWTSQPLRLLHSPLRSAEFVPSSLDSFHRFEQESWSWTIALVTFPPGQRPQIMCHADLIQIPGAAA
jgi:hypothetical protein